MLTHTTIPPRTVECYHCGRAIEVAARAMTLTCPLCYQRIKVDDVVVMANSTASNLRTCGRITVGRNASLEADAVEARLGVEVLGTLNANVTSGGVVSIGPKAVWNGNCTAAKVVIAPGARIVGGTFRIGRSN